MRKFLLISFFVLLLPAFLIAKAPRWAERRPSAENATYRYVVESATAMETSAALNKAMGRVYQDAIMSLGLPVSSAQVENTIRTGNFESLSRDFQIPVNKVCDYIEKLSSGGVRVYVLCQVGVKSDRVQKPQFTEFRNCGSKGDTDVEISGRPDEWERFDADTYFHAFLEHELGEGENEYEMQRKLTAEARLNLVTNLNMTAEDNDVAALIQTDQSYNKQMKTVYVVAYVEREKVIDIYKDKVEDAVDDVIIFLMPNVSSYIAEGNMPNAKATLDRINKCLEDEIEPRANFLRAYSSARSVGRVLDDVKEIKTKVAEKRLMLQGGTEKHTESKVQEFVTSAEKCVKERKLADALRYFYAGQMLLKELSNGSNLTVKTKDGKSENANTYIASSMKSILSGVQISFDGFLPDSKYEAKLGFIYKGEAVTNLSFKYNDNSGYSDLTTVRDGWAVVELPIENRPKTIDVKLEYRYEDEAAFDPELQNIIIKNRLSIYEKDALHHVEVKEVKKEPVISATAAPVMETHGSASLQVAAPAAPVPSAKVVPLRASTDMCQNIVADRIVEKKHTVMDADSAQYMQVIGKVCEAINARRYKDIYKYFTANGCNQLDTLLNYGKAHVYTCSNCRFIRIGDEVMCRSIPMQFTFSKGKKTTENVVLTFDSLGKIDGIQFALEERSARNIMSNKNYSETAKLTLVNFMENYKTAFAMKRINYINSIFADDAVIIVGRVLKHTNKVDINQKKLNDEIEYTRYSKGEYMKRLANQFSSKEWINIKFSNTNFKKTAIGEFYAIQLLQDYMSNNYGDRGYLFLLIDCSDPDAPLIKVRSWQPETAGAKPFSLADYEEMINKTFNWK